MESVNVQLNQVAEFDQVLRSGLPEGGDIRLITKDDGTEAGAAVALLTWSVGLPAGGVAQVQAVTTVKLLKMALAALNGRYDDEGRVRQHLTN